MYQVDQNAYWQGQLTYWGPKILIALAILIVTWIVARAVKWVIQKGVEKVPMLRRHVTGGPGETLGHQLGVIAKLVVWLVGIMAALSFLGVGQILTPINRMLVEIFDFLPRLIGAGLIFFVGLIVARILRQLTETVVTALNIDGAFAKLGLSFNREIGTTTLAPGETIPATTVSTRANIARALGIIVFALVIFPISIASLQALGIESISAPLTDLLDKILLAIPAILTAVLWIGIAFIAARFVKSVLEAVLPPLGFDRVAQSLGILPATASASRITANIAMVAIILTASIEAAKSLGGGSIAIFLEQITALGGKVIFGSLIIVAGIFLSRIIAGLVASGTGENSYAQTIVKYAIIALFTAIGLTFMGLADQIVMLAFGLILGSAAVAAALAFGIGGRDWAAKRLEEMSRRNDPPSPMASRTPTSPPSGDSQPPLV